MKKNLFLALFLLISNVVCAQNVGEKLKSYQCTLIGVQVKGEQFRQGLRIYFPPRGYLDVCHEDGRTVLFPKSNLGLSTYMKERGWTFVKYESDPGTEYMPRIQERLVIMEKLASSEEEALKGLFFKQDFREGKLKD